MFFKKKTKPFVNGGRINSVAIITDGNGRWAKRRGMPRSAGHVEGAKRIQPALEKFRELGIHHVTFYAFSTENWKRPKEEVDTIMKLVYKYVDEVVIEKIKTVTVNGDGSNNAVRKYTRTEETKDITITEFDGEGFISPKLADSLDKGHNSFQVRMPYIKGVVHKVDFAALLSELEVPFIVDIWDKNHNPADVDIILTDSMFKGLKWMTDNDLSWAEYLERCKRYNHALYVSGKDKIEVQDTTELNYQFLNTLSITDDEFRPKDLPFGFKGSPEYDSRHWITKTTETEYYRLVADNVARRRYFTDELSEDLTDNRRKFRAELIKKNALFIDEPSLLFYHNFHMIQCKFQAHR
jgi:hypothetical protein